MANSEVLRDLIRINNDRVTGYTKAATQAKDQDLQSLFSQLAQQSRQFANELRSLLSGNDSDVTDETTTAGKIYRAWMDVKATFAGDNRKSILASCEFGEDAAQKSYKSALKEDDLTPDIRVTIERQKDELLEAHDRIKMMRDRATA
ncbi:MAG TPA: PA2169 family four-helix-bundle protein [Chitinophagaceae bacterium]|nr:PA2169 family four-helix-bundle protein [Chitinophagaceae bacterium]